MVHGKRQLAMAVCVDDMIAIVSVPDLFLELDEKVVEGLVWWILVKQMAEQSRADAGTLWGPPTDILMTVTDQAAVLAAVDLRHDCPQCRGHKQQGMAYLRRPDSTPIAFIQLRQGMLRDKAWEGEGEHYVQVSTWPEGAGP